MAASPAGFRLTPPARRRRWLVLLFAWAFATGAPWDLVQVFAWGRMWVGHAQTQSVSEAIAATFSPEGLCGMCEAVQSARTAGDDNAVPLPLLSGAIPLVLTPPAVLRVRPPAAGARVLSPVEERAAGCGRAAPPVPPPRGGAV